MRKLFLFNKKMAWLRKTTRSQKMRKLASIKKIQEIKSIPNADRICAYRVDGWWVVDQKDKYSVGDLVIHVEVDAFVPNTIAPFLTKGKEPREYNGVKGERLKTIKLKQQISQGLLLPLYYSLSESAWCFHPSMHSIVERVIEGQDVTERLGIQKWEPPIPVQLQGLARGNFPSWGRKTDQERCQNLIAEIQEAYDNDVPFEVTIKLDGSSMSVGHNNGDIVVCSRNLSLKLDQENNTFVNTAKKLNVLDRLSEFGNILISGELMGPGIQKNREGLSDFEFFVFDIFDVDKQQYVSSSVRYDILLSLGLKHVPVLESPVTLRELGLNNVDKILEFAEGSSLNNKVREGVVFKSIDGSFSFKAISNKFLLGEEDE